MLRDTLTRLDEYASENTKPIRGSTDPILPETCLREILNIRVLVSRARGSYL